MQKYKNPLKDLEIEKALGINPYVALLEIPVSKFEKRGEYKPVYDKETGEKIMMPVSLTVESRLYARVYSSSEIRKLSAKLPPASTKLLLWIIHEVTPSKDYLWLNKERFMEEASMSYNTYKKALSELKNKLFITTTDVKDVFWINPKFFFKGNPMNKYPDKVIIKYDTTD